MYCCATKDYGPPRVRVLSPLLCGLGLLLVLPVGATAQPRSQSFSVPAASLNGGGAIGLPGPDGATVDATIGQASPLDRSTTTAGDRSVASGFWLAIEASVTAAACVGDCTGDGVVTIDELILGVNIALGNAPLEQCSAFDSNANDAVTIDELLRAVSAALSGCA